MQTKCFRRDSTLSYTVVVIFILMTVSLLLGAVVKEHFPNASLPTPLQKLLNVSGTMPRAHMADFFGHYHSGHGQAPEISQQCDTSTVDHASSTSGRAFHACEQLVKEVQELRSSHMCKSSNTPRPMAAVGLDIWV